MKKITIKVKGGYVPSKILDIHEHIQLINQGKGSPKPQKGKGSYKRQYKHKNKRYDY
ncbi:TPA: hypothetical protein N2D99_002167 [Clostridium botulinum]|nr:hypothetical protein [Clostridium botulinum]